MIVVDTNTIAYLHIPGPLTDVAEQVFRKDPSWVAPPLWRSELRNVLLTYIRSRKMSVTDSAELLQKAESRVVTRDVYSKHVLQAAVFSGCTAYDCEFVSLAEDLGIPLVTSDAAVLKAFPHIAISLKEFPELK